MITILHGLAAVLLFCAAVGMCPERICARKFEHDLTEDEHAVYWVLVNREGVNPGQAVLAAKDIASSACFQNVTAATPEKERKALYEAAYSSVDACYARQVPLALSSV